MKDAGRPTPHSHRLWLLLAITVFVGCGGPTDTTDDGPRLGAAVRVHLEPEVVNFIGPGESVQMTATLLDSDGRATVGLLGLSWSVSDASVASLGGWTRYQPGVRLTAEQTGATEVQVVALSVTGPNLIDTSPVVVGGRDPDVRRHTMRFEIEFLDLDSDTVITCSRPCAFPPGTDVKIAFDPDRAVHSVVVQNQAANVQIAYIDGGVFGDVTSAAARAATFTTALIDRAFEGNLVILIQTDQGATFKLGNPEEAESVLDGVSFDAGPVR